MSEWNVAQPLDYSATGDDIDSASQKIIATFVDVYDKLNRLRSLDASAEHTVGDAAAYSIKIDTSVTPAAILIRNAANTGYIQIGSVAENLGVTAEDVGAIQGDGMGKISLGAEANLPSTATTYDLYFAYDTGRLYMYRTGAWRVFLSLRFEDLLGVGDAVITRDEVAANGANKIPQLNSVGQGEFDITGNAAKIGGKNLYLPELHDNQVLVYNGDRDRWEVAPRDDLTNADVSTTGEPDKIVKTDSNGNAHVNITGNAAKVATKAIDVNNLQDGDVLVYDATRGVFYNKQGATVNAQGVVEANVSGSAQKWAGKAIQTVNMVDGQILVWSEANQAFINRNQSAVGNARALSLKQDGVELANYNGDEYRAVNIITPHLRVAGQAYTAGQTCFSKNMASTLYLECVTPGVTANVEPDFSTAAVGDVVADGGVEWKVCGYVNTEVTDALDDRLTVAESDIAPLKANNQHDYRQPSTAYAVGDIAYHASLPTGYYLECTTAGITGNGELSITTTTPNTIITDDAVVWAIRQIVNIIASPSYYQREQLPTPARTSVTINPTWLNIGGVGYTLKQSLILNLNSAENWDVDSYATTANRAGKDVYIYATATADSITPGFVLSLNSTVPTGYTADNSRKIGGFHCLCVDVGSITGHTLTGYVAGDILPQSVWDLSFRAVSENAGMVFVPGIGKWVDIYLPSWSNGGMASAYGGTIVDGSSTPAINGELAVEYFGLVGKELISRDEFIVAMAGSNQGTNIYGSADPGTTGGHKDTANRRMISNYGIEDGCGARWQWGRDQYENFFNAGGNATTYKGSYLNNANDYGLSGYSWQQKPVFNSNIESTAKGQCDGLLRRVLLGADWSDGAVCGSRAAYCAFFSANYIGDLSARGVSSLRRTA